jgi:hypothetical protein
MQQTLFLVATVVFIFGCSSDPNSNSNVGVKFANQNFGLPEQTGTLVNKIEQASFKYTSSDLFKTGKVSKPQLIFSADTLINYNSKKHQVKLKYFNVRKAIFGMGSFTTGNNTVLLFTKDKQVHYFEIKGAGSFEFIGQLEDQNYFKFSLQDRTTNFSLNLNAPVVRLTEYTVASE